MKQYKLTSADFVTPGESLEPDAYISAEDLAKIKSHTELKGFLHQQIVQRLAQFDISTDVNTIIIKE